MRHSLGEFCVLYASDMQMAVFHYDITATTGCSNIMSPQHKNLPPTVTVTAPSFFTLPSVAHVIPLLQVGSIIIYGTESQVDVLSGDRIVLDVVPPPPIISSLLPKNNEEREQYNYSKKGLVTNLTSKLGILLLTALVSSRVGGDIFILRNNSGV